MLFICYLSVAKNIIVFEYQSELCKTFFNMLILRVILDDYTAFRAFIFFIPPFQLTFPFSSSHLPSYSSSPSDPLSTK